MDSITSDGGIMSLTQAAILGLVEGVTEYLPVSSTGHLILVDQWLGLRGNGALTPEQMDAIEAFEIVIQSGAIIAVLYAYVGRVKSMVRGLMGHDAAGRKLLIHVTAAFIPAMVIGLMLHKIIKTYLQQEWPTVFALAAGGVVMILWDRSKLASKRRHHGRSIEHLDVIDAVKIGLLQCVAMWPGTSRSMMTILGGQWVGLSPVAAAEFSFLLGLPTLLAATAFKAFKDGHHLVHHIGFDAMGVGLSVAAVSAFICVKGLIAWLSKHGLQPFGWYRLALASLVAWQLSS
jgi:undecaprenyl-diphosphatase